MVCAMVFCSVAATRRYGKHSETGKRRQFLVIIPRHALRTETRETLPASMTLTFIISDTDRQGPYARPHLCGPFHHAYVTAVT